MAGMCDDAWNGIVVSQDPDDCAVTRLTRRTIHLSSFREQGLEVMDERETTHRSVASSRHATVLVCVIANE
jgi:hypothetical protein